MIEYLRREREVERPTDPQTARYVRSWLLLRTLVGLVGIALPILLVLLDRLVFESGLRDSLSAYYHSGVRDLFVGGLCAIAFFLVAYKIASRSLDNTLSCVAGIALFLVALFPTGLPEKVLATPLQERLGETLVGTVHYAAAAIFLGSLAWISFLFGMREGKRGPREGKRTPTFWQRFHWTCAGVIVAALLWIVVTALAGWPPRALLAGEVVAVWAFSASWLMKGLELDTLRRT